MAGMQRKNEAVSSTINDKESLFIYICLQNSPALFDPTILC